MKKKLINMAEFKNLDNVRRMLKNAASSESSQGLLDAIRALIDEIETADVEYDEEMIKTEVEKVVSSFMKDAEPNDKTKAAITEAIAKRMTALQNSVKTELPVKVKNQICAAILRSQNKEVVENNVREVLVNNDISGLSFNDVIDYVIVENWGDSDPLFRQLRMTPFSKFFYSTQDINDAEILAKQWDKTSTDDKTLQEISVSGKALTLKYVYKILDVPFEDLDAIEEQGEATRILTFINEELDRMIVRTIVMAILVGDAVNDSGERVTCFETIGTKSTSDAFTNVVTENASLTMIENLRAAADAVVNPYGKKVVMIMSKTTFTEASKFYYTTGTAPSTPSFRTREEVAAQLGIDEIILDDIMGMSGAPLAITMIPDGYWVKERKRRDFAYPVYLRNKMNYQKERNIGGGIHDLKSTSVLLAADDSEE